MKAIAFFTPLPPMQSGISDYSVDILTELAGYYDIDVFIDVGYKIECELPKNICVYPYVFYEVLSKKKNYFDTVFQMGNSEYHFFMWKYIKKIGGTVVVHDANMRHAAEHYAFGIKKNPDVMRELLLEDYTEQEVEEFMSLGKFDKTFINGFVCNYANKIIVHADWAKAALLERNPKTPIKKIFLNTKVNELPNVEKSKEKLGINKNCFCFMAFGHITPSKRPIAILKAFERICNRYCNGVGGGYKNVKLYFVGKLSDWGKDDFLTTLKKYNLQDDVVITGYTELDEFNDYLDAADLCLNLRWPYNGETSAVLMRALSKGKCIIVNDVGSFSEIPDECCVKLPSAENLSEDTEVENLYNAMEKLISSEEGKTRIEKNARKFAEENLDVKKCAKEYAEFIKEVRCLN